jgi:hypothetical protein
MGSVKAEGEGVPPLNGASIVYENIGVDCRVHEDNRRAVVEPFDRDHVIEVDEDFLLLLLGSKLCAERPSCHIGCTPVVALR